jgi:hypothetical protein
MNSAANAGGRLDVTETAGTFKVPEGKYAFVQSEDNNTIIYGTGTITLPAGEYTLFIIPNNLSVKKGYSQALAKLDITITPKAGDPEKFATVSTSKSVYTVAKKSSSPQKVPIQTVRIGLESFLRVQPTVLQSIGHILAQLMQTTISASANPERRWKLITRFPQANIQSSLLKMT